MVETDSSIVVDNDDTQSLLDRIIGWGDKCVSDQLNVRNNSENNATSYLICNEHQQPFLIVYFIPQHFYLAIVMKVAAIGYCCDYFLQFSKRKLQLSDH